MFKGTSFTQKQCRGPHQLFSVYQWRFYEGIFLASLHNGTYLASMSHAATSRPVKCIYQSFGAL
jgi:hypothetical protein